MDELEKILIGCRRFDRTSQELLYKKYYPAMYTLCKKFFKERHEIQTALNNGMLLIFKNIQSFDIQKGTLFNWMYQIVRNSCLTTLRKPKHPEVLCEFLPDTETLIDSSDLDWVFECLDYLPKTTRAICSLYYIEGFSIKEISEDINMKVGTVKWHLNESRTRLKIIIAKRNQSQVD
tara:strand:+ start:224 stop:754 length:531 start_codon:yes stop_codon:yes gene_type:complete